MANDFVKKDTLTQVFSCEICENLRTPPLAASVLGKYLKKVNNEDTKAMLMGVVLVSLLLIRIGIPALQRRSHDTCKSLRPEKVWLEQFLQSLQA